MPSKRRDFLLGGALAASALSTAKTNSANYFPPPDERGGWRTLDEPSRIRSVAGMDPAALDRAARAKRALAHADIEKKGKPR